MSAGNAQASSVPDRSSWGLGPVDEAGDWPTGAGVSVPVVSHSVAVPGAVGSGVGVGGSTAQVTPGLGHVAPPDEQTNPNGLITTITNAQAPGDPDMSPEAQEALRAVVRAAQARALADPEWEAMAARQAARIADLRARTGLT